MKPTRRELLASLGLAITGSAALSTTAFTRTRADRVFNIGLTADDEAQLSITEGESSLDAVNTTGQTIELQVTGLNAQADTVLEHAVAVTNQNAVTDPAEETRESSVYLYVPGILNESGNPVPAGRQEGIELLVGSSGQRRDISLPPNYNRFLDSQADEAIALSKVTDTGAVELAYQETVLLTIRVLDFAATTGESLSLTLPVAASLREPDRTAWNVSDKGNDR